MEDVGYGTPSVHVRTLEGDELRRSVENLTLSDNDLMEGVLIHELIVVTSVRIGVHLDAFCTRLSRLHDRLLLWERDACFLGGDILTGWKSQHGQHLLLLNGLEWAKARLHLSCLERHQNSRLYRLQIESNRAGAITASCNFSLYVRLSLIIELDAFAGNGWGSFLESWCQVDVLWNQALIDQRHHAFIDGILTDRWIICHVRGIRDSGCVSKWRQWPRLVAALGSVALRRLDEGSLENVGSLRHHQFALVNSCTVQLVHAKDIRLHAHQRLLTNGSTCSYDFGKSKIGQVLLSAAKVHRHRADKNLIFALKRLKSLFQLHLELGKMRWDFTCLIARQVLELKLNDFDLVLQVNNQLTKLLRIHIQLLDLFLLAD